MKQNMKKFNIGTVRMEMESNGFPKGFILKRELTLRECRYILKTLFGIDINDADCFNYAYEYKSYNDALKQDVNGWLKGECYDDYIMMEYAGDCGDEPIGIMNLVPLICYLKKKNIID